LRTHWIVFFLFTAAFYLTALTQVSVGRVIIVLAGSLVFAGLLGLARSLKPVKRSPYEPILLIAAAMGFLLPASILPPPRESAFLAAGFGVVAAQIMWAGLRYEVVPVQPSRLRENLAWAVKWGVGMAAGLSILALIIAAITWTTSGGTIRGMNVLPFALATYWIGGLVGGVILGIMRPLTAWPLGAMFVGVLIGFCLYSACAATLYLSGDPEFSDMTLGLGLLVGLMCAVMVGPVVALGARDW
jgi:hypothetical protein